MPRFWCFSYSEAAFVDYGGVVKVNGMVMGPCMVRNSGAFSRCFYISSCVKRSASFTNITPRAVAGRKEFCRQRWFVNPEQGETSGPGTVVVECSLAYL